MVFRAVLVLALSLAASLAALAALYPPREAALRPSEAIAFGPKGPQGRQPLQPLFLALNASDAVAEKGQRGHDIFRGGRGEREENGAGREARTWGRVSLPVRRLLQSQVLPVAPD